MASIEHLHVFVEFEFRRVEQTEMFSNVQTRLSCFSPQLWTHWTTSYPISPSYNSLYFTYIMYQGDPAFDLFPCQYVFQYEKSQWQSPNHNHPLHKIYGINCNPLSFQPFLFFPFSGRDLNITFLSAYSPAFPHRSSKHRTLWSRVHHSQVSHMQGQNHNATYSYS